MNSTHALVDTASLPKAARTAATRPVRYDALCGRCYTCVVARNVSKRDAERAAVSHMNAFGCSTWIAPTTKAVSR